MNNLPIGCQVTVSNGSQRPPDRFRKKVDAWKANNFFGVVVEHLPERRVKIQRRHGNRLEQWKVLIRLFRVSVDQVTPIDGADVLPVINDGVSCVVDIATIERAGVAGPRLALIPANDL